MIEKRQITTAGTANTAEKQYVVPICSITVRVSLEYSKNSRLSPCPPCSLWSN